MSEPTSLSEEMGRAKLGDERRSRRLRQIVKRLETNPSQSFPRAADDDAELEGIYRFMGSEHIDCAALLEPHIAATVGRAKEAGRVLVVHDSTEFNFGATEREGLGMIGQGKSRGFLGHFALCVMNDGSRRPLGVLGIEPLFRHKKNGRRLASVRRNDPNIESLRWNRMQEKTADLLGRDTQVVHVMDREADQYALLAQMKSRGDDFVVRMWQQRTLADGVLVEEALKKMQPMQPLVTRDVTLPSRRESPLPARRRRHPARAQRIAKLSMAALRLTLPQPRTSRRARMATIDLNLVVVSEIDPPDGEEPITWRLWTSLPIDSPEQVLAIVDAYRARWVIEEYFKALKSGCIYERRQLSSQTSLLNALAILAPIAWRLLLLRSQADLAPDASQVALTAPQLVCLRAVCQQIHHHPVPPSPTARETMLAIARMGGHIKNNGDPGWLVLGRGYAALRDAERAVAAVLGTRCDQS
jgi:hypothetical protein